MSSGFAFIFKNGPMEGKGCRIKHESSVIGRSSDCEICLKDPSISRQHARLYFDGEAYVIEDLGSQNGLRIGEEKVESIKLHHGLEFKIGKIDVVFVDSNQPTMPVAGSDHGMANLDQGGSLSVNEAPMQHSSKYLEQKQKRIVNTVILLCILFAVFILGAFIMMIMSKKDRPVHKKIMEIETNSSLYIDLDFTPYGEAEALVKPFMVKDYTDLKITFDTIEVGKDIVFEREPKDPEISDAILVKTRNKTGRGEIQFFKKISEEEKQLIGVLYLDVNRKRYSPTVEKYLESDLNSKIAVAENLLSIVEKYEEDELKQNESWEHLMDAKAIFLNGEAKPEVFHKVEAKLYEINKRIEAATKKLYGSFFLSFTKNDISQCLLYLKQIADINPDKTNLFRQKAVIYHRRLLRNKR